MKHEYKGLKENLVIKIENRIYKHRNTKKMKKILQMHGSLECIYLSCIRHCVFCLKRGKNRNDQPTILDLITKQL